MKDTYITLKDGCKIFAEYCIKNNHKHSLIYVHGGPGQGCWDFKYTAEKLSEKFNIIMFDQRGVLRSDKINDNFTTDMLVEDIENIRKYFNLNKVTLCGHSYGSQILLRYAIKYPEHIHTLIHICPSFNFKLSLKNVFKIWEKFSDNAKTDELIRYCLDANDENIFLQNLFDMPHDIRNKIYYINGCSDKVNSVNCAIKISDADWAKGKAQQSRIFDEGKIYYDYCQSLSQINIPSLAIVGEYDPIFCPEQQNAFLKNPNNKIYNIKNAGHSLYSENADEFIKVVSSYF